MNIFISSTYIDLIPHRKEVWKFLKQLPVTVQGMEKFGARKETPLDTCLNEVKQSDVFIAIIGMRYGSIDINTGKSFTQLEYEEAVKGNKEIIVYLINEHEALIHPNLIDFENHEKLQEFKSILRNKHNVDFFKDEKELIRKLFVQLLHLFPYLKSRIRRPKILECTITRFTVSKEPWIIVTGYSFGYPVELYIFRPEDFFDIPKYVTKGLIIKRIDYRDKRKIYYDFQFQDKDGYKTTAEGISVFSQISTGKLNAMLSVLLNHNTDIEAILEVLPELGLSKKIKNINSFKRGLKKALMIT